MKDVYVRFNGTIDRRNPRDEFLKDKENSVYMRENFLARDGKLKRPVGTVHQITTTLTGIPTWITRYNTVEIGQISPKSFFYTQDGKAWVIDDQAKTATVVKELLNKDAYPNSDLFKLGDQVFNYFVDGEGLYKYDGNNANNWEKVKLEDSDGNSVKPTDVKEFQERLCVISDSYLFISKNLEPDTLDDATDSIQIQIGKGRGKNLSLISLGDNLYIFNTEGIYILEGIISAVASTFWVRQVDDHKILSGRTCKKVESAIFFLASDYNVWAFNGSSCEKKTHNEKLEDFINTSRDMLDKAVATYEENYYKLSFVEKGSTYPNLEWWWDSLEDRGDFVRGRNVACYLETESTVEEVFRQIGKSNEAKILNCVGTAFDTEPIRSKLWTKDITIKKGHNVRFRSFYLDIEPISATMRIDVNYLLDGRIGNDVATSWTQALQGETWDLGQIHIANQSQVIHKTQPKIDYARGQSIAFYIDDAKPDTYITIKGMRIDYITKHRKKDYRVSQ